MKKIIRSAIQKKVGLENHLRQGLSSKVLSLNNNSSHVSEEHNLFSSSARCFHSSSFFNQDAAVARNISDASSQRKRSMETIRTTGSSDSLNLLLVEMNKLASRGKVDRVLHIWDCLSRILKGEHVSESIGNISLANITEYRIESCLIYIYVYILKAYVNAKDIKGAEESIQKYFITSIPELVKPQNTISSIELQKLRFHEHITPVKPSNASVYTLMMKLYSQVLDSASALRVFQALEKDLPYHAATDTQANNTMLSAYISSSQFNSAQMFYTLRYKGPNTNVSAAVEPDFATYSILLKLYSELGLEEDLYKTFEMTLKDFPQENSDGKQAAKEAKKKGKVSQALLYDPYRFNVMIAHIAQHKREEEMLHFFEKYFKSSLNEATLKNPVIPTIHTYNTIFKFYSEKRDIQKVQKYFELMVKDRESLFGNNSNLFLDSTAFHVIIDAHLKCGKERQAREIFENFFQNKRNHFDKNLMKPNISHYNLFLEHYANNGMESELEEILTMMDQDGTKPDAISAYYAVKCACKRDSALGVEEFKRWFISDLGVATNPRPRRFPASSRVYEELVATLIRDGKIEKMEEVLTALDKDTCKRSGSIYRRAFFAYINSANNEKAKKTSDSEHDTAQYNQKTNEEKLDDALRIFRTYFISPISHHNAGYKADLLMCNSLLTLAYNHENPAKYKEAIKAIRYVRDKLQQKTPQELKKENEQVEMITEEHN